MTTDVYNTNGLVDDPYAVDVDRVKAEIEAKKSGGISKVKWHQLPEGEAMSMWRILPFPKKRTFFVEVRKHWAVPGMKGSITCPRSFEDPERPGKKLNCAICEKFFAMLKSNEPGDQAFAKQALKSSISYYANALAVDANGNVDYEKGIGVLNLPYGVYKVLVDWLGMPKFQMFSHPSKGRNIIITSTIVAGAQIPGQPNRSKRDYSVTPDDPSALTDLSVLEQLYDLDTVVGIPTFEFTETCLERIVTGDENLKLPDGVPAWRGQLNAAPEQVVPNTPPTVQAPPVSVAPQSETPHVAEPPKFAQAPTVSASTVPVTTATETLTPSVNKPAKSEDDIRAMMMKVLNKK
jgi:hypothetical protein